MALDAILAHKRAEVSDRERSTSLDSQLAHCTPSDRDFEAALRARRPGFILEIKFASPSAGVIRAGTDLTPVLESYGRHADAVSVLTDARFFGGSLARLTEVRRQLSQPVLCKDFILGPYQVAEARAHGADAILLILAAIDDPTWRRCADLATRLQMAVLTEVHNSDETARAVALGARIIGVNNRDLRTLAVDLGTTARLAPVIPETRLVVAESGIASRDDVASLRPHADAFLVGSALMRESRLDAAVRGLVYGRTKVCGLTRPDHAAAAVAAGATHGGLVFADGSPRRLTRAEADSIRRGAPLDWVAVFVRQPPDEIAELSAHLDLSAVQLHGDEAPDQVARVRALVPDRCEVWQAVRVRDRVPAFRDTAADRLLLDGWSEGRQGGTGTPFDWRLLREYAEGSHVVLAGGLNAGNAEAAAALMPWALDVSSGVESAPGIKDPALLRQFFLARRRLPGRGDDNR